MALNRAFDRWTDRETGSQLFVSLLTPEILTHIPGLSWLAPPVTWLAAKGVTVGGQVLSLLLTLLATPVIHSLFDDARAWFTRPRAR